MTKTEAREHEGLGENLRKHYSEDFLCRVDSALAKQTAFLSGGGYSNRGR